MQEPTHTHLFTPLACCCCQKAGRPHIHTQHTHAHTRKHAIAAQHGACLIRGAVTNESPPLSPASTQEKGTATATATATATNKPLGHTTRAVAAATTGRTSTGRQLVLLPSGLVGAPPSRQLLLPLLTDTTLVGTQSQAVARETARVAMGVIALGLQLAGWGCNLG
jgi:hypothetical protein